MKKIICCMLILGLVVLFASCGDSGDVYTAELPPFSTPGSPPDDYEPEDNYDPQPDYDGNGVAEEVQISTLGFSFVYNDTLVEMDQDMDYLLPQLGEPAGVFEAPSCAFDGIDRIFGFGAIQIHTYPDGDLDRVHTVSFLNDNIATVSGISLGSSIDDVLAVYGNDYVQDAGMFVFTRNGTTLSFFVDSGMVIGIIFGLIME